MQATFNGTHDIETMMEAHPPVHNGRDIDPTLHCLPLAKPFSEYCNTNFWRFFLVLCLFEFIVLWHDLWDPLVPINSRGTVKLPVSFCIVLLAFSALLLLGNDDRLTGMAQVAALWLYVAVFTCAAVQNSEEEFEDAQSIESFESRVVDHEVV
jgi:hypothetical protein